MSRRTTVDRGPSLFERAERHDPEGTVPLADRVRPKALAEMCGHLELLGAEGSLAQAIADDRLGSIILWGPPGCGKTSLAHVIAESTRARFVAFSAVLGGVAELRKIVATAKVHRQSGGGRTLLFVDEIHRFNKAQQDAFLPHVEDGSVTLIGATTENPSFELNAPLLSRCTVYRLEPLTPEAVEHLVRRALDHPQGLAEGVRVDDQAIAFIVRAARGDARRALGWLERAASHAIRRADGHITATLLETLSAHDPIRYDKSGDEHFDVVSAFIKSMRGSDPDAAIYWMMRMVEGGDDPLFILRRIMIFASEDIGVADPRALSVAVDADRAFRRLGMPEGLYAMAQATLYLACAPKSNASNVAWHRAREAVREHGALAVPLALRNAPTALMKQLGHGGGYRYPHDESGGVARGAEYLPAALVGAQFYEPTDRGLEAKIQSWLAGVRSPTPDGGDED
jgi:putative ATPase